MADAPPSEEAFMTKWQQQRIECTDKLDKFYCKIDRAIRRYGWQALAWVVGGCLVLTVLTTFAFAMGHNIMTRHDCVQVFLDPSYTNNDEYRCPFCQEVAAASRNLGDCVTFIARVGTVILWGLISVCLLIACAIFSLFFGGVFLWDEIRPRLIHTLFWRLPIWLCTWWHLKKEKR